MTVHNNRKLSMELIGFQDNSFGKDIEYLVAEIRMKIDAGDIGRLTSASKVPEVKKLEHLILNRLGITTEISINVLYPIILSIPAEINMNSQSLYSRERGNKNVVKKQHKALQKITDKAWVDNKKAKVGGFFSELPTKLYINFYSLVKNQKLSTPEIVAVILHELGHLFNSFELTYLLSETNLILEDISTKVTNRDGTNISDYVYVNLSKVYPEIEHEVADRIANSKNNMVLSMELTKVFTNIVKDNRRIELDPTGERLADRFASRFGYGRELVSALIKFNTVNKGLKVVLTPFLIIQDLNTITAFISLFVAIVLPITMPIILRAYLIVVFKMVLYIFSTMAGNKGKDYDDPADRYKYIRNDVVGTLKDSDLDLSVKRTILKQVELLDESILNAPSDLVAFKYSTKLYQLLSLTSSDIKASNEYNLMLDELANNDLFVQSAKFDTAES